MIVRDAALGPCMIVGGAPVRRARPAPSTLGALFDRGGAALRLSALALAILLPLLSTGFVHLDETPPAPAAGGLRPTGSTAGSAHSGARETIESPSHEKLVDVPWLVPGSDLTTRSDAGRDSRRLLGSNPVPPPALPFRPGRSPPHS